MTFPPLVSMVSPTRGQVNGVGEEVLEETIDWSEEERTTVESSVISMLPMGRTESTE